MLWRKRLFAHLYPGLSARHEALVAERKRALFREALRRARPERVLEIGPGPGTNLAHLPEGVAYLALEPNPFFHPRLREEARKRGLALTLLPGRAEAIPLPGGSVDLVVATLRELGATVATGRFRTDMQVELVNDGPTTVLLEV